MISQNVVENESHKTCSAQLIIKQQKILEEEENCQIQGQILNSQDALPINEKKQRKKNNLTQEQIQIISNLYSEHRSKWSLYVSKMTNRNEREIKNFFYNSLRKLATRLSNIEKKKRLFQKNNLDTNMLRNLVDISILVKRTLQKNSKNHYDLLIYKVKQEVFNICFKNYEYTQQQLLRLSKDIRKLKFMFKNLKHIEKSIISESQAQKFAITVVQKQLFNSQNKYPEKFKLDNQELNPLQKRPNHQKTKDIEQNQQINKQPGRETKIRIQQYPCVCKQCTEFHHFQQIQYFQAMQQLHQQNLHKLKNNFYCQSRGQNFKFYSDCFSNFYPYIPVMCKSQANC